MTNDGPLSPVVAPELGTSASRQRIVPANSKTLSEQAYEQLRAEIQSGSLAPGVKLSTSALKDSFGVSLSTIREALTRLVGESFVTLQGQRGFRVAPVSLRDLHDLIALRKLVEGEGLALSIQRGDDAWEGGVVGAFHELQRVEARLKIAIPKGDETEISSISAMWEEKNGRFHWSLVSACGSPRLLKLYGELYDQTARYRQVTFANHGPTLGAVGKEHKTIFEAVMSRNIGLAQDAAGRHLVRTLDFFEAYVKAANRRGVFRDVKQK